MKWCVGCQAQNADEATACAACGAVMAPAVGWWVALSRWKYVLGVLAIAAVAGVVYYRMIENEKQRAAEPSFGRCLENGRRYFKEIGSWPNLSDGRLAEEVVGERCNRRYEAFPDK